MDLHLKSHLCKAPSDNKPLIILMIPFTFQADYEIKGDTVTDDFHYGPMKSRQSTTGPLFDNIQFLVLGDSKGLQKGDCYKLSCYEWLGYIFTLGHLAKKLEYQETYISCKGMNYQNVFIFR